MTLVRVAFRRHMMQIHFHLRCVVAFENDKFPVSYIHDLIIGLLFTSSSANEETAHALGRFEPKILGGLFLHQKQLVHL